MKISLIKDGLNLFTFFALSKCTSISKQNDIIRYEFHFKGFYRGKRVERIIGESDKRLDINENQECVVKFDFLSMNKTDLIGYIKKIVLLEEISY